jgi:hypothetical protein
MKKKLLNLSLLGLLALASCKKTTLATDEQPPTATSARLKTEGITTIYYVDDTGGNDGHDGKSEATAWKTISKVNSITFTAGNQILFKAGGSWTNRLHPLGSGAAGSPIIISKYTPAGTSTTTNPKINGAGTNNSAIYFYNQKYWEITNLDVTNYSVADEGGTLLAAWETNNAAIAVQTAPSQVPNSNPKRYGLLIQAQDAGAVDHIYLHNLVVHGVDGAIGNQDSTKSNGGIVFQILGSATSTHWNDILIDNCTIHDTDGAGLLFQSTWGDRSGTFDPSTNVISKAK